MAKVHGAKATGIFTTSSFSARRQKRERGLSTSRRPDLQTTRTRRATRGIAIAEAALVSPLLILMLVAVADFGRVFFQTIALTNAARAGAQFGSFSVANSSNTTGIALAAQQEAADIGAITVSSRQLCQCPSGTTVSCTTGSCGAYGLPQVFLEVTVTKTFTTMIDYPGIPHTMHMTRVAKFRAQ
jgi:Flp pilus assembly protein TadG